MLLSILRLGLRHQRFILVYIRCVEVVIPIALKIVLINYFMLTLTETPTWPSFQASATMEKMKSSDSSGKNRMTLSDCSYLEPAKLRREKGWRFVPILRLLSRLFDW